MAMDPNTVQMEALRRKNAGDPRPLPQIVQELMATAEAAQPVPVEAPVAEVTPTPAQPVPVGQPVEVRPAMPPMATPFNPVERARAAAAPEPAPQSAPTISATDAAVKNAQDKRDPLAASMASQQDIVEKARKAEFDAIGQIREQVGVDRRVDELLKKREERYAQREAEIAKDEKLQAWNALAMAGFKMAQSTSPYFAAALSEGLQAGLEGFNASKAAAAEKKARLEDAKDAVALDRIESEDRMEARAIADRSAGEAAGVRALEQRAKMLEVAIAETREPLIRQKYQAELQQIYTNIASTKYRDALAGRADARAARAAAGDSGSAAYMKAYRSGIADEAEYGRKFAEGAMEQSDLRPGDPGYSAAFQAAVSEGRSIFRNSNPQWSGIANAVEGVQPVERPKNAAPAPAQKKEESWWDRIFG